MGNALTGSWMWADAGAFTRGLAKRNPLRWSMIMKIGSVIDDLEGYKSSSAERPVKVVLYEGFPNPLNVKKELQLTFLTLQRALEVLQEYCPGGELHDSGVSSETRATSAPATCTAGEAEDVLWKSFRARLGDQVAVIAKWNRDANTLWCEKWRTLEQALESVNEQVSKEEKAEQPITLNIKVTMKEGTVFRYFTEVPTAEKAKAIFEEVSTVMEIPSYTVDETVVGIGPGYNLDLTHLADDQDGQQDLQPTWATDSFVPSYGVTEAPAWSFDSRRDAESGPTARGFNTMDSRVGTATDASEAYVVMDLSKSREELTTTAADGYVVMDLSQLRPDASP